MSGRTANDTSLPRGGAVITTEDVIDRFNGLDISGFRTGRIAYVAREKLILQLSDAERVHDTTEDTLTRDYELQFNRVLDGQLDVDGPWFGKIQRSEAYRESELLAEALRRHHQLVRGEEFAHYRLIGEHGQLDVIARDFFLTVVDLLRLNRRQAGGAG